MRTGAVVDDRGVIHDDLEFHNVAELAASPGLPGLRLHRLPAALRQASAGGAPTIASGPTSAEIRCVADGPASITVHAATHPEHVLVLQGEWVLREEPIGRGETRTIALEPASAAVTAMAASRRAFAPEVWRLQFGGVGAVHYLARTGVVRPPAADEKPRLTWLAHGSAITRGLAARNLANPWVVHAARLLAVDLVNLGMDDGCALGPAMAEHIAGRKDWQLATIEPGLDLLEPPLDDAGFAARARSFIGRIASSLPRRPVGVITPFPTAWEASPPEGGRHPEVLRRILRAVLIDLDLPNLRLYEGPELLTDLTGLSTDGHHPSDYGHIDIGDALARRLRLILPQ